MMNNYSVEEERQSIKKKIKFIPLTIEFFLTCSVSTKFATAPSSLTPRTLNRVPARSQLNLNYK